MRRGILIALVLMIATITAYAQRLFPRAVPRAGQVFDQQPAPTQFLLDRHGVPDWEKDAEFPDDVFTFVRIMYNPRNGYYGSWQTDYPDSDLNFSFRLQQLTSLKVDPNPIVLELTDPRLFNYPFIYFCEPGGGFNGGRGGLNLSEEEAQTLRKYLDNGGFAMFDDFWGEAEWAAFYHDIKKVFPDRDAQDIPLDHPLFHIVYDLQEKPQVPSIGFAQRGMSYERPDASEVHYRGFFDDNGRLMALACHNTDLGDGWEREGEDENYFHEYSEKKAYPMGINIIFYVMTH